MYIIDYRDYRAIKDERSESVPPIASIISNPINLIRANLPNTPQGTFQY